ncbi:hypothetical protein [Myroides sp. N17-2]|uniref:hypothetical protein n=1 Tax=Myroides sp. N17-2 TaxID=2030799 RepID=UPI000EFD7C32|nr:hypothetical protein [Myroides sp. N17-2]
MNKRLGTYLKLFLLGIILFPSELLACTDSGDQVLATQVLSQSFSDTCGNPCCDDTEDTESTLSNDCCQVSCQSFCHISFIAQASKQIHVVFIQKDKNTYPIYQQPLYSSEALAIWQPPKIG